MWLLLLFSIAAARADDCATVNLAARGGSMENVEPTNQGSNPDCYAHAAAYMASAFIQNHSSNKKHQTAPDAIYADVLGGATQIEDANTGRTCNAIEALRQQGSCDRKAIDRIQDKVKDPSGQHETWIESLEYEFDRGAHPRWQAGHPKPGPITQAQAAQNVCSNLENNLKLPEKVTAEMSDIWKAVEKDNPGLLVQAQTQKICQEPGNSVVAGKDFPEFPRCEKFDFRPGTSDGKKILQSPDAFKAELHDLLRAGNRAMPVGIEYCSGVIYSGDGEYIKNRAFKPDLNYLNTSQASENLDSNCAFHASVVIGQQRKPDGKCYFEIQNSFGTGCDIYGGHRECDKKGHVWVPEDELARNIVRISHF